MAKSLQLFLFLLLGTCPFHGSRQSSKPSEFALQCGADGGDCEEPIAASAILASPPDGTIHLLEDKKITPKNIPIESKAVRVGPDGISFEIPEGAKPGDHSTFKVNGTLVVYEYTLEDKVGQTVMLPVVKKRAKVDGKRSTVGGEEPRQAAVPISVKAVVPITARGEHSRQVKLDIMREHFKSLKQWVPVILPKDGMIDRSHWWISGNANGDMLVAAHGTTGKSLPTFRTPTICGLDSTTPMPYQRPLFTFKGDLPIRGLYAGGPEQEDIWRYAGEYLGHLGSADFFSDSMVEVLEPENRTSPYKMNFEGSMDFKQVKGYPTKTDYD